MALADFAFHHSKNFNVNDCFKAIYCLRTNKPLQFISRTNLLSCDLLSQPIFNEPFSLNEMIMALKSLKGEAVCGPDLIHNLISFY
ncbi:hypothetical protein BpHYR1_014131 [Brachionus plicatilis]|uniref:Uncharacterized protein n=1 Tax=Brachionus plicatilis TaxID=10195 RepID=A0A3M7QTD0_BRAPC|nr:hypothetical protein BpHYR1_014131 [Brachionus plicatilis]